MMTKLYSHLFEFTVVGSRERPRFSTNASPPHVCDLVDLHHLSELCGPHKVIQVLHIYEKQSDDLDAPILSVIEITLKKIDLAIMIVQSFDKEQ